MRTRGLRQITLFESFFFVYPSARTIRCHTNLFCNKKHTWKTPYNPHSYYFDTWFIVLRKARGGVPAPTTSQSFCCWTEGIVYEAQLSDEELSNEKLSNDEYSNEELSNEDRVLLPPEGLLVSHQETIRKRNKTCIFTYIFGITFQKWVIWLL